MHLSEIDQNLILEPAAPLRASIEEEPLNELANSIRDVGLLQPVAVIRRGEKFEVIHGHRRLLATRIVGLPRISCLVVDQDSDDEVIAARLHENIFRRDISPVEEAALYAELFEKLLDVDAVAKLVKRSRGVVENRLNLLSGDREILKQLQAGMITSGVAEQLNKVKFESTRRYLLEFAVRDGASIEKVRNWRLQYCDIDIGANAPETPPITVPDGGKAQITIEVPRCYFCGSDDDQHEMLVLMVHASCKKMIERQAEQQQKVANE
jgi:ParB family transcriptional regulator, chromosome partitioning protein